MSSRMLFACLAQLVLAVSMGAIVPAVARADVTLLPQSTFAYDAPSAENRIRALLETTGVYVVGFTFYVATNRLLPDYDVEYSWPVLREKLLGTGFELDVNGLNTNFVGHPLGGSMYYTMARSNQLNVAVAGNYQFATNSDDGSQLLIDGAVVVDNVAVGVRQEN